MQAARGLRAQLACQHLEPGAVAVLRQQVAQDRQCLHGQRVRLFRLPAPEEQLGKL